MRHFGAIVSKCKHCKEDFEYLNKPKRWMIGHTRWCLQNPKREEYVQKLINARAAKTNFNNQYTYGAVCNDETKKKISKSLMGRPVSDETRQLMSKGSSASPHRRLRRNLIEYKGVLLDSTWELELAKRLDDINVEWLRPQPIPWTDNDGKIRNYFPDFYLPKYDIFLDPKNPYVVILQEEKIKILLTIYPNIVILDSLEKCRNFTI